MTVVFTEVVEDAGWSLDSEAADALQRIETEMVDSSLRGQALEHFR